MNPIYDLSPDNLLSFALNLKARRVQIITSCTGTKSVESDSPLTWSDFVNGAEWVREREQASVTVPAKTLYSGRQHTTLMQGITDRFNLDIDLSIVSAGYGLIAGDRQIAPYEATFSGLGSAEIKHRAEHLNLPADVRGAVERTVADLTLVLLGADYLKACNLTSPLLAPCPTLFIGSNYTEDQLQGSNLFQVPLTNEDAKAFNAGQVWLKSVIANQVLAKLSGGVSRECA